MIVVPAVSVGRDVSRLTVRMAPPIAGTARVSIVLVIDGKRQVCASGQVSPGRGDSYSLSVCPTYQLGPIGKAYMRANPPKIGITRVEAPRRRPLWWPGPYGIPRDQLVGAAAALRSEQPNQPWSAALRWCGQTYRYWENVPTQWATWKAQTVEAFVEVSGGLLTGEPELTFETGEAPRVFAKNSVAFDAATSAQEISGDGVISLSHTSTGDNRAVYAGMEWNVDGGSTGSVAYAGSGLTQINNTVPFTGYRLATYRGVGQTTGAQTVTGTTETILNRHFLGVISMTGVDQTTPVGTAPTPTTGTATPATITVASVGADDLVVDAMGAIDAGTPTVGADQTSRTAQAQSGVHLRMSTQPGTAGGVMSWTLVVPDNWGTHAIAFKPAAAAGLAIPIVMHHRKMMES